MAYGPVSISEFGTTDVVAPGAPSFITIAQLSNSLVHCVVALPTLDSDGSELTGLVKLTVATLPMSEGINPFEGLSMPEILALTGVVTAEVELVPGDAGTQKEFDIAIVNLGGFQAFAAACAD